MALSTAVRRVSSSVVDRWQNGLGLQLASASRSSSTSVGPAGRRRPALFSGGLARSFAQWLGVHRVWVADGGSAASLRNGRSGAFAQVRGLINDQGPEPRAACRNRTDDLRITSASL